MGINVGTEPVTRYAERRFGPQHELWGQWQAVLHEIGNQLLGAPDFLRERRLRFRICQRFFERLEHGLVAVHTSKLLKSGIHYKSFCGGALQKVL